MKTVNVHEAKSTLSALLAEVESGEEVIIARNGAPVARLSAVVIAPRRIPGVLKQLPGWEGFTLDPAVFAPLTDAEIAEEGWPV